MGEFAGKVVLVTGAGRGLGRELALAFAARGGRVAANDLTPINLDETVAQGRAAGGTIHPFLSDVAKKIPLQTMLGEVGEAFGPVEILVNNAAVEPSASLLSMDEWDWDRTLAVNLKGPFLATQSVARMMAENGEGVIVNLVRRPRAPGGKAAFVASQLGLIALTLQSARELAAYNIRVHAVWHGEVGLGGDELLIPGSGGPSADLERRLQKRDRHPVGAVDWVLFLCSDAATDLTGHVIDGDQRGG